MGAEVVLSAVVLLVDLGVGVLGEGLKVLRVGVRVQEHAALF